MGFFVVNVVGVFGWYFFVFVLFDVFFCFFLVDGSDKVFVVLGSVDF